MRIEIESTILFVALAIKCKNCVSSESMEDCKGREESVDCNSASLGFVADHCVKMSLEYLNPLSKTVTQSNYANKAMKRFKAVNRLAARHVKLTVVIQTIVTVEQLPWLVPC